MNNRRRICALLTLFLAFPAASLALQDEQASNIRQEVVSLRAEDGGGSWGVLYTPRNKRPTTAVLDMHPRGDRGRDDLLVSLAEAGFAGFGHNNRYVNNDIHGIHENMVLDIAAGVKFLKKRGYSKIVLMGVSGGGPLMSFYQAQAVTPPPGRVARTPAGDPPNLNEYDLPAADGLLTIIPHLGEGHILEVRIDPSVIREEDPLSIDPSLDMYNSANGFRLPPAETVYSQDFVQLYRAGQRARMERLDRWAKSLIAEQNYFKKRMKDPSFGDLPLNERQWIERNVDTERMMTIHRTWADLRYMDLTLDRSDRTLGNNRGLEVWRYNYAAEATPGHISPRAFLSSRSSLSTHSVTVKNIAKVKVPTLIVQGTAQRAIYPSDTQAIYDAAGATDKKLVWVVGGDAGFNPSGPKAGKGDQRQQRTDAVISWMTERFPH